ncbi:MAG TPA: hypothetical protein ENN36_07645 [Candidatus Bathyarchaeota archaeon]|nr:hypothetical protein [Candidatus Bathyarchaeota archaeon]
MPRGKGKTCRLSVFKGREAKLNRAIFQVLKDEAPQAMWDILRNVCKIRGFKRTKYAVINTRVKALEAKGYLTKTGERDTKQGGETNLYKMTARARLAVKLSSQTVDDLINRLDEDAASTILEAISSSK